MKYISTLLFLACLAWTWSLATGQPALDITQHKQVEAGVEADIRGFIQRRFPYVNDVYCPQLYTESVRAGTDLIAHFRCQAAGGSGTEEATEQIFEGELRLHSDDNFETWSETGGSIAQKEIRFLNEIKVTPSSDRGVEKDKGEE